MASLLALAGGALVNALAFSGGSALFQSFSSNDEERVRHDKAIEHTQSDQIEWEHKRQKTLDMELRRLKQARTAEGNFQELDASMREYSKAWEFKNPYPQIHQYYTPSIDQQHKNYQGAFLVIAVIGGTAYYFL